MLDANALGAWALEHLTGVRVLMLLSCVGWFVALRRWLRPDARALRAGTLAVVVQLGVGTALDIVCVRLGAWSYRDMPLLVAGVPADLHLDWALLWGFGLVWLADRWPGRRARGRAQLAFLLGCVALTVCFDAAIHRWMLFIEHAASWWWAADAVFLTAALGLTLWMHRSTGSGDARTCGLGRLPPLSPRVRALLLASTFVAFFFVVLPGWIVDAAEHFGVAARAPAWPWVAGLLAGYGGVLLLWGLHEFAVVGRGTPVPWDPPRRLVTTGPYAFTANPMQTGGVLLALACAAACPTWVGLVYALDVALVVVVVFRPAERRQLAERFGSDAATWAANVRPFVWRRLPWRPLDTPPAAVFYDAGCGPCRSWVGWMARFDETEALRFAPLHGALADELLPSGSRAASGRALALWEPGLHGAPARITTGGEAVLRLVARLPFPLCTLGALSAVPGLAGLVELVYRVVARLRPRAACGLQDEAPRAPYRKRSSLTSS